MTLVDSHALSKTKRVGSVSVNEMTVYWFASRYAQCGSVPPTLLSLLDFLSLARHTASVWQFCGCVTFTSRCGLSQVKTYMLGLFFYLFFFNTCHWRKEKKNEADNAAEKRADCPLSAGADAAVTSLEGQTQHLVLHSAPVGSSFLVLVHSPSLPLAFQTTTTHKHLPASAQRDHFSKRGSALLWTVTLWSESVRVFLSFQRNTKTKIFVFFIYHSRVLVMQPQT